MILIESVRYFRVSSFPCFPPSSPPLRWEHTPSSRRVQDPRAHGRWQSWVLDEKVGIEHIKFAYDHGINTFE